MDNLPGLRDIHLPDDPISVLPLAKGWWLLLTAIVVGYLALKLLKWSYEKSTKIYVRHMLKRLYNDNNLATAVKISEIFRRICIRQYPQAVALTGSDWINFLNSKSKHKIDEKTAQLLQNAPFVPAESTVYAPEDIAKLWQFCYQWTGENL